MPTVAERLNLLLTVHGHSYRDAGLLCGVDHTTILRVARSETENLATLAKIAEGYEVPVAWLKGEQDLGTDFAFSVLLRPLRDRVLFLTERNLRLVCALQFLREYAPDRFTVPALARLLQVEQPAVEGAVTQGDGAFAQARVDTLCRETGLPVSWFQTGMVGREDEEEMLVGLAEWALESLAGLFGLTFSEDEIHEAALALV